MRAFTPADVQTISGWYNAHGLPPEPADAFPVNGVVEPGVAAGFLYGTDARGVCLLEGFITNPDAPASDRAHALQEISAVLIDTARQLGFTRIYAMCKTPSMERLASRMGMQPVHMVTAYGKGL